MNVLLIIEKADEGFLGRVEYDDNLIVDEAEKVDYLEEKIKQTLKELHNVDPATVTFEHKYDLTALFDKLSYLKISSVASLAGMHPGLLRQYVSGVKYPSAVQAQKIEEAIHQIAKELSGISIFTK
jgi:hypothetical protein